jgi:trimeric autotransporter adhesin
LTFDASNNLLFADGKGRSLRAITSDGKIQTIAGGGTLWGMDSAGHPSTDARVNAGQLATGPNGRIYIADPGFSSDVTDDIHVWVYEPAQLFRSAVLNAASYRGTAVAGGEMVTIYGLDIGPKTLAGYVVENGKFKNIVANTRVLFDGIPAPIIYVSETAASVVVPYAVAGKHETDLWIEYQGVATNHIKMPVSATQPGIFTIPPVGSGQAALLHWPDYSLNGAGNALARGGVGMVFLTGGGELGVDGEMAQTTGAMTVPVNVRVGGVDAQVLYAGPAPTLIYGMLQVNFIVPDAVTPGDKVPVLVQLGPMWSQQKVTMAVK